MDKLKDPWVFSVASAFLIGVATYVWSQLTDKNNPEKAGGASFVIALLSILLLTWLAQTQNSAVLMDPYPA